MRTLNRTAIWIAGIIAALLWFFPIYWMLVTSVKPESRILAEIGLLPTEVTFNHYLSVFNRPVARWFLNSVVVAVAVTGGNLLLGAMAGYALARLHFPGKNVIFYVLIASLMIPGEMTIVPLFIGAARLKLINSYWALILPPMAGVFSVYLYRQFFLNFPRELEDAAAIDGCNRMQTWLFIALPLARAATLAGAILVFTGNWNAFLWPLLIAFSEEWKTLPVGMAVFNTVGMQQTDARFGYGTAMAAMTLVALPTILFFLLMQRYFIQGITQVGIKG